MNENIRNNGGKANPGLATVLSSVLGIIALVVIIVMTLINNFFSLLPKKFVFKEIHIQFYDSSTNTPLSDVKIAVAWWVKMKGTSLDLVPFLGSSGPSISNIKNTICYSDNTGMCSIPALSIWVRATSIEPTELVIRYEGFKQQRVRVTNKKEPEIVHEFAFSPLKHDWDAQQRRLKLWLEPVKGYIQSNRIAHLCAEEDDVWVGVFPPATKFLRNERLWSRYDTRKKHWEFRAAAPAHDLIKKYEKSRDVYNPEITDIDGTVWKVRHESKKDASLTASREAFLIQQDSTGAILKKISLNQYMEPMAAKQLGITQEWIWIFSEARFLSRSPQLFRIHTHNDVVSDESHLLANVNKSNLYRFMADYPYLWLGTNGGGLYRIHPETREIEHFTY